MVCKKFNEKRCILYSYYKSATNILDNGKKINTLECGLKLIDSNILLYCIKDKDEENKYLMDVTNFKEITYDEYQYSDINDSMSRHSGEKISGIKNRAYTLESLINFYFKNIFNLIELHIFILKLAGKDNYLYKEFDSVFYNNDKNEISIANLKFAVPFNHEIIIKFNSKKKAKYNLDINSFIPGKSLIVIEVKSHFPREKSSTIENESLPEVIMKMTEKLPLLLNIILDFPYKFQKIHLMLFYDQNKLTGYKKECIEECLNKYKQIYLGFQFQKSYDFFSYNLYFSFNRKNVINICFR